MRDLVADLNPSYPMNLWNTSPICCISECRTFYFCNSPHLVRSTPPGAGGVIDYRFDFRSEKNALKFPLPYNRRLGWPRLPELCFPSSGRTVPTRFLDLDRTFLTTLLFFAWNSERLNSDPPEGGGAEIWLYWLGECLRVQVAVCLDEDPHK